MSRNELPTGSPEPVERKIQLAGNSTYVVSLPKEWAVEQDLESGTSMYLYPQDDRLVAATGTVSPRDRSVTIDAAGATDDAVVTRIQAAYLTGCDRITVVGLAEADPGVRRRLERTVARLIGVTVQVDDGDGMTIGNVLDASEVSLPQTIVQARQLAVEMHADATLAVLTADEELARQVIARDDDVDRLFAFVSRGVYRGLEDVHELDHLGTNRIDAFRDYRIARELERIADHATGIARAVTRQDGPPTDPVAEPLEVAGADARAVSESALDGDPERARETATAVTETLEDLDQHCYEATDSNAYLYGTIVRRVRATVAHGRAIADVAVGSSLANESIEDRSR